MKRSLILNLLMICVSVWLLATGLTTTAGAQTVNPLPDETATAEPILATATPTTDAGVSNDWQIIQTLITLGSAVLIAVVLFTRGDRLVAIEGLVKAITKNPEFTQMTSSQYERLPPHIKVRLSQLVDVLDPLTNTTPTDLDNQTIAWLLKVIHPASAAAFSAPIPYPEGHVSNQITGGQA